MGEPERKKKKFQKKQKKPRAPDDVLLADVNNLLRRHDGEAAGTESGADIPATVMRELGSEEFPEIEVTVAEISSTGDGLALSAAKDHVYVVPFTTPGDKARVRVYKSIEDYKVSETDLLEVLESSGQRDDSLIFCKYFGKCSGCQLQMISYEDQLKHKKRIIEKAYANFSGILPELIPAIDETMGSPLQTGYRTKLTPHFSKPTPKQIRERTVSPELTAIGFNAKGKRRVVDIEDCPLGTDIVRKGFKNERQRVLDNIDTFKAGATILVRETTTRKPKTKNETGESIDISEQKPQRQEDDTPQSVGDNIIRQEFPEYTEEKSYVSNPNGRSCEFVDGYQFYTQAGSFFQNNNSILTPFIEYIRQNAHPASVSTEATTKPIPKIKYLLDAYCGSGLFTITLSKLFLSSLGVDVSVPGIQAARANALANTLGNAGFAAADAADLFHDVPYPADQTLLIIDPPRKGCDMNFLNQMLAYGPARAVYVSCNVHTQARDIGTLVQGGKGNRYEIESIKGFDFFPHTGHVESVAVLTRVAVEANEEGKTLE